MKDIKGITVKKAQNFSEWYSQVVQKAELADLRYDVQGFIVHMPWATRIARKIYEYFEHAVEADDHEPMLLPTVILEDNLEKEKEHAGFSPEVFWVTHGGDKKFERKLALRPTGETQIYPMYSLWIRSHNDLPFKRYQSRITAFRHEMTTRPFMRGREFMFFETHDVFSSHKHAMEQIHKDMGMMNDVVRDALLLPFIFFKRPQWDKFLGAEDTFASDTLHPDGRRSQLSSTHDLGTNFAKPFNVTYTDKNGHTQFGHQTCFGPGIWRLLAALIAVHGDDKGLILPFDVAPIQVVIIPIVFAGKENEKEKIDAYCTELCDGLKKHGLRAKVDARDVSPGEKFATWELKGVPLRIEVGPREVNEKTATLVKRTDRKKEVVAQDSLVRCVDEHAVLVDTEIKGRAATYFAENTQDASTFEEVKKKMTHHRGFIRVPFCSIGHDGEDCATKLKNDTSAYVCGVPFENPGTPRDGTTCIICNKPARHIVSIATSI